jgi:asparaginyl-tRNA synthetase
VRQILPVIISPITDPLSHDVFDAGFLYFGQELQLTKSMILHKQIALMHDGYDAIYAVSPCVRLEKDTTTSRHLLEFSQVDFEFKDYSKEDVMHFMEELIVHVFSFVKDECKYELTELGRSLSVPTTPFKVFDKDEVEEKLGIDYEKLLSEQEKHSFLIISHEREFYDKEDPVKPGKYLNYDLVYPEGFGEALSGGEREHEHEQILKRMKRLGMDLEKYSSFVHLAERGILPKTAGAGFGVERLVRYLTGAKHIKDVVLFPKVPGEKVVL